MVRKSNTWALLQQPAFCSISGTGSSSVSSVSVGRPAFVISGASGPCASKVNGIFDVTEELSGGRCVCIKRDEPDVCLHFWEPYICICILRHQLHDRAATLGANATPPKDL